MPCCEECGARYADPSDSCSLRFEQLLALDHSRREPWGSRHGLAFAAFALQHPSRFDRAIVDRSRELIERVVVGGQSLAEVVREFRSNPARPTAGMDELRSTIFAITIADLGDFSAETYAADLERWCRAALQSPHQELGLFPRDQARGEL